MPTFLTCQVKRISVEAGLPNVTGEAGPIIIYNGGWYVGALSLIGVIKNQQGTSGNQQGGGNINFDASRSSAIYGDSNTVTPLSLSTVMLMKY